MQEERREFVAGHLDQAHRLALEGYNRTTTDDPLHTGFLIELARVSSSQASYDAALRLLGLPLPTDTSQELLVKHTALLAVVLVSSGDTPAAKQILLKAAALERGTPNSELEAARGYLERKVGHYPEAVKKYKSALDGAETSGDEYAQMRLLINIGSAEILQEQFDRSREVNEKALTLAKRLGAGVALEKLRGNMGWASLKVGNLLQAEEDFRLAKEEAAAIGSREDANQWAMDMGLVTFQLGDVGGAEAIYQSCLQQALRSNYQNQIADIHLSLGALYLPRAPAKSLHQLHDAADFFAAHDDQQNLAEVRLFQALLEARNGNARLAAPQLLAFSNDQALPSQRWKAEQELADIAAKQGKNQEAEAWYKRAIRTFQQQQSSVVDITSKLPFQENGTNLFKAYIEYLIAKGRTDEALLVYDQARATSLRDYRAGSTETTAQHQPVTVPHARLLASRLHSTLLIYYPLPETTYLWAVSRDRTGFYRLPGEEELNRLIQRHEALITNSRKDPIAQGDEAGQKLFELLIGPALSQIKPGDGVYVLADRGLSQLNFDTLLTPGEHPHFWIEDVTITNAASLRLLNESLAKPVQKRAARLLVLGDPEYPKNQNIEPLPHAAEEVHKVEAHFVPERSTVLTGSSATSAAYEKQNPGEYSNIHIVAHAEANLNAPMESYVLLAGASDKLYAHDVLRHPLKADLVVLSTCYSSGTTQISGEGVVGLAWAFERAGSRNVIGSLWEVSDASAPELMDRLYADLASGKRPDRALRNAKLAALHSEKYSRPFYWAPFQLYSNSGDDRVH